MGILNSMMIYKSGGVIIPEPEPDPAGVLELGNVTGVYNNYVNNFTLNITVDEEYSLLVTSIANASTGSGQSFTTPSSNRDGSFTRFPNFIINFGYYYRIMSVYYLKNPTVGVHTISYGSTSSKQKITGLGVIENYGESDREFTTNYTILSSQNGSSAYDARGYITAVMYGNGSSSVSPTGSTQRIYANVHNQAGDVLDLGHGLGYSPDSSGFGWSGATNNGVKQAVIPIL